MTKLEHDVEKYMEQHRLLSASDRVLVACSGGIDSIVLLHYLHAYTKREPFQIAAVHVNHMLRDEAAAEDRRFVEAFCNEHQIPIFATDIPIASIHENEKGNLQDICRRERYDYFERVMKENNFNKIAIAHHAEDQVESILMALVKGANDQGVLGMPPMRDFRGVQLVRPFLATTREEIETYCSHYRLSYKEDASNAKDVYMRNRFRHHIVPLLKEENQRLATSFQRFSEKSRMDDELLNDLAMEAFYECVELEQNESVKLAIIPFQKHPPALQRRVILLLLKYLYKDTIIAQSYTLWTAILQLTTTTEGHAEISLPDGGVAKRQYDVLTVFRKRNVHKAIEKQQLSLNKWYLLPDGQRFGIFQRATEEALSTFAKVYSFSHVDELQTFFIRSRMDGDRMHLSGMANNKKVSRIFIDAKIPMQDRMVWPLLVDSHDEILAIPGIRVSTVCQSTANFSGMVMIIDEQI